MKINICLIFCFITQIKLLCGFFFERQRMMMPGKYFGFPRFTQMESESEKTEIEKLQDKEASKPMTYNLKISVIRESDKPSDRIPNIPATVQFSKDGINVVKRKKVLRSLRFIDFLFWDGNVFFDSYKRLKDVHTPNYVNVLNKLKPKMDVFIGDKGGEEEFDKFCSTTFRIRLKDPKDISKGKENTVVFFCFSEDATEMIIKRFREEFIQFYTSAIAQHGDLLEMQIYEDKQPIMIQFYDPALELGGSNPQPPNYFTSFNSQGMVLSTEANVNPQSVKFSFRFDQIIDCRGLDPKEIKSSLPKTISNFFKSDECCIGFTVDWNLKPINDLFCSLYKTSWKCKTDMKLFLASTYARCLKANTKKLKSALEQSNNDLRKADLTFLRRAQLIELLREVKDFDLEKFLDPVTKLYKEIHQEKPKAADHFWKLLKGLEDEVGPLKGNPQKEKKNVDDNSNKNSGNKLIDQINKMRDGYLSELNAIKRKDDGNCSGKNTTDCAVNELTNPNKGDVDCLVEEITKNRRDRKTDPNSNPNSNENDGIKDDYEDSHFLDLAKRIAKMIKAQLAGMKLSDKIIKTISDLISAAPNIFEDILRNKVVITIDILEKMSNESQQDAIRDLIRLMKNKDVTIRQNPHNNTSFECPLTGKKDNDTDRVNDNINPGKNDSNKNITEDKVDDHKVDDTTDRRDNVTTVDEPTVYSSDDDFNNLKSNCDAAGNPISKLPFDAANANLPVSEKQTPKDRDINLPPVTKKSDHPENPPKNDDVIPLNSKGRLNISKKEDPGKDTPETIRKTDIPQNNNPGVNSNDDNAKNRKDLADKDLNNNIKDSVDPNKEVIQKDPSKEDPAKKVEDAKKIDEARKQEALHPSTVDPNNPEDLKKMEEAKKTAGIDPSKEDPKKLEEAKKAEETLELGHSKVNPKNPEDKNKVDGDIKKSPIDPAKVDPKKENPNKTTDDGLKSAGLDTSKITPVNPDGKNILAPVPSKDDSTKKIEEAKTSDHPQDNKKVDDAMKKDGLDPLNSKEKEEGKKAHEGIGKGGLDPSNLNPYNPEDTKNIQETPRNIGPDSNQVTPTTPGKQENQKVNDALIKKGIDPNNLEKKQKIEEDMKKNGIIPKPDTIINPVPNNPTPIFTTPLNDPNKINGDRNKISPNDPNKISPNDLNKISPNDPNNISPNDLNKISPNDPNKISPNDLNKLSPNDPNKISPNDLNKLSRNDLNKISPNDPNKTSPNYPIHIKDGIRNDDIRLNPVNPINDPMKVAPTPEETRKINDSLIKEGIDLSKINPKNPDEVKKVVEAMRKNDVDPSKINSIITPENLPKPSPSDNPSKDDGVKSGNLINTNDPNKINADPNKINTNDPNKINADPNKINTNDPNKINTNDPNKINADPNKKNESDPNKINTNDPNKINTNDPNKINTNDPNKINADPNKKNESDPNKINTDPNKKSESDPLKGDDNTSDSTTPKFQDPNNSSPIKPKRRQDITKNLNVATNPTTPIAPINKPKMNDLLNNINNEIADPFKVNTPVTDPNKSPLTTTDNQTPGKTDVKTEITPSPSSDQNKLLSPSSNNITPGTKQPDDKVGIFFAGSINTLGPRQEPTVKGFYSRKMVVDPILAKKISEAFRKVNADLTPDQEAASKSVIVAKLRKY